MKKLHLIVSNKSSSNAPIIASFNFDETLIKNPNAILRTIVDDFLKSSKSKEYTENGERFYWADAIFAVPTEFYIKRGLYPSDLASVGVLVDCDEVLNLPKEVENSSISAPAIDCSGSLSQSVLLYTDGACLGNPGPGGWGAILCVGNQEIELSGFERSSTNNRMELSAALGGLEALTEPCKVTIVSDSKYLVDSIEKDWISGWKRNGWKNSQGSPTPNVDLWEKLLVQLNRHDVSLRWVKGHNGHPYNERCDKLAVSQCYK